MILIKRQRNESVNQRPTCIRETFQWSTILRSLRIFSTKHRINPHPEKIGEIWQENVEISDLQIYGWHEKEY